MGCLAHDYGRIPGIAVHTEEIQENFVFRMNKACNCAYSVHGVHLKNFFNRNSRHRP